MLREWDLSVHFKDARARVMAQPIGVARPSPCSMPGREGVCLPPGCLVWELRGCSPHTLGCAGGRCHVLLPRSSTLICYMFCPAMAQSLASQPSMLQLHWTHGVLPFLLPEALAAWKPC